MSDFIARRLRAFARFVVVTAALATPAAAMILPYPSSKNRQGPGSTPPPSPSPAPAPPPHAPAPAHPPAGALMVFPGGYVATIENPSSSSQFSPGGGAHKLRGRGLADFVEGWILQEHLRFDPAQGRIDETRGSYLRIISATDAELAFTVTNTRGGKAPWPSGFGEKKGLKILLSKRSGERYGFDLPEATFVCRDDMPNCKSYGVPSSLAYAVRGCDLHRRPNAQGFPTMAYVDTVTRWPSDANHSTEYSFRMPVVDGDKVKSVRCHWDAKGRCDGTLYERPNFQGRSVTVYGAKGVTNLDAPELSWFRPASLIVFCTQ